LKNAFYHLGPFIVTMLKCHPSEKLFEHYTKMTDPTVNSLSNENEVTLVLDYPERQIDYFKKI